MEGGAASEALGVFIPGSSYGNDYTAYPLAGGNGRALALGTVSDGIDFDGAGNLYANVYTEGSRNQLVKYAASSLVNPSGTIEPAVRFSETGLTRIRNVAVYEIGGKTLLFAGEGGSANGKVIVVDVGGESWTKRDLVTTALSGEIMNVKVAGSGTATPTLYVASDKGEIAVYRLMADGLSVVQHLKTVNLNDGALCGASMTEGFRSFEVTADGNQAFFVSGQRYNGLTKTVLTVVSSQVAPSGYTRLAYLESSGTQYIDTGYTIGATDGFAAVYSVVGPNDNLAVCGSRTDSGDTRCMIGSNFAKEGVNDTIVYVGWGGNHFGYTTGTRDNKVGTARVNYLNSGKVVCRGESANLGPLPTQDKTFCIFGAKVPDGILYGSSRIYDLRISSGGACIRHYIPVRRNSDSALGLYDTMNGGFLENAGTGKFIAGPVVDDASYEQLQFLQSSGTQYVDTGVLFTDKHGYSITWQDRAPYDNSNVCGSRSSNGDTRCVTGANGEYIYVGWNTLPVQAGYAGSNKEVGTAKVNYRNSRKAEMANGYVTDLGGLTAQSVSFYLFAGHYGSQNPVFSSSRIMAFEMTYEDEVVMSLIPARRKTDGLVGLYDQVNGDFYLDESVDGFIEPARSFPQGYAQLAYVESTGSQYINTRVKNSSRISAEIEVYDAYQKSVQILGARKAYQDCALGLSFQVEVDSYGFRTSWGTDVLSSLIATGDRGLGEVSTFAFGDSRYIRVNGVYAVDANGNARAFGSQDYTSDLDIYAFGLNNNGTPHAQGASVRISALRLYDGGRMVRDYIPMLSLADFKPGLYDRLNGVFHGNAGSGELLSGIVVAGMDGLDLMKDKQLGIIALDGGNSRTVLFETNLSRGLYRLSFQCRKTDAAATVKASIDGRKSSSVETPALGGWVTLNMDVKLYKGAHALELTTTGASEIKDVSLLQLQEIAITGLCITVR